mgnify:FL=1
MAKNKTFHKKKTLVVFLGCMLMLTVLIGRLVNLMVVQSEYYAKKADDLHERERKIKAARGRILDANGVVLADNKTVCTISVIHSQIKEPEKVIAMLTKELGHIDFSGSAVEIERLIRGLNSWPSAYTKYEGKTLKIWKSRVAENSEKEQQQKPGTIVRVTDDSIYVQTGDGVLELLEVQLEGKKRMQVKDFLLGHRPQAGIVLG